VTGRFAFDLVLRQSSGRVPPRRELSERRIIDKDDVISDLRRQRDMLQNALSMTQARVEALLVDQRSTPPAAEASRAPDRRRWWPSAVGNSLHIPEKINLGLHQLGGRWCMSRHPAKGQRATHYPVAPAAGLSLVPRRPADNTARPGEPDGDRMRPYLEPTVEFFDHASVPAAIQELLDEWPEIDPGTARLVRTAVMSREPRRLRQAWEILNARAALARAMRSSWR
jgi:hypothetical protein